MKWLLCKLISVYQLCVRPLLGQHCRFEPSCSQYARQALEKHGVGPGLLLAIKRLLRCHPWHPGGYDPIPVRK
jgi:putative membrane protein insertion efficiency factor